MRCDRMCRPFQRQTELASAEVMEASNQSGDRSLFCEIRLQPKERLFPCSPRAAFEQRSNRRTPRLRVIFSMTHRNGYFSSFDISGDWTQRYHDSNLSVIVNYTWNVSCYKTVDNLIFDLWMPSFGYSYQRLWSANPPKGAIGASVPPSDF